VSKSSALEAIRVPKEVFNADSAYLIEWLVSDASEVKTGTPLCEIETSKSTLRIEATHAGYVRQEAPPGSEVPIGGILGYLSEAPDTPLPKPERPTGSGRSSDTRISAKAQRMIEKLGLDVAQFEGKGLVRESDVKAVAGSVAASDLADPRGPSHSQSLSPIQRRVARAMQQSVSSIPAAYMERVVELAPVKESVRQVMEEHHSMVTILDALVYAVSRATGKNARLNGFFENGPQLRVFDHVNVGLAINVDEDLFMAVVRKASDKSLLEIATQLRALEYKAQRRRLTPEESLGGTITVTSMLGRGVHRFNPILYPEQSAIIGICDNEVSNDHATLTLGFDHRVVNGAQAADFLSSICNALP
jgi:pyruvate dehydrogenase E2 component (dihydrolipoamide acetyltransferase)